MGTQKFVAVVRKEEETSFGGEILGLGCFFTGETLEETLQNGLDALKEHLDILEEAGEVFHTDSNPLLIELDLSDVVCLKVLEV